MKQQKGFGVIQILLILVVIAMVAVVGWYTYQSKNKANNNYNNAANASDTVKGTTQPTENKATNPPPPAAEPAPISDSLKENTAAAIESQNTAALQGYMTSTVTVVIAASEKGGSETAVEAIMDLEYLKSGTSPWDFQLDAATLTSYKNGFYGQYFGERTIVGQSANNYVVSFGVNASGKIDSVFMAASADLLTQ